MNWLFLRGKMERHKECRWGSLEKCTDMWTHLFSGVVGNGEDFGSVVYSNGNRAVRYRNNFLEVWIPSFKSGIKGNIDIIVARGGFKEYIPVLKKFPKAKKVYYGANHGCIPKDNIKYDLILCDSKDQVLKCRKHNLNGQLFIKPAAPQFYPRDVEKKYDVGFSAIWPKDKRKRVSWVHTTAPRHLKILQMGHACKAPSNFSVKYIQHDRMPRAISKCKVIIAPYTKEDSCPRIIPESIACGVPVFALGSCQFWDEKYPVNVFCTRSSFWSFISSIMKNYDVGSQTNKIRKIYEEGLSVPHAAKYLRELILYG